MLKLVWWGTDIYIDQCNSLQITYKGEHRNSAVDTREVTKWPKLTLPTLAQPSDMMHWGGHNIACLVFLPKILNLNLIKTKCYKNTNWRILYKNEWSLKCISVKKDKERLRKCSRRKETKGTWEILEKTLGWRTQ